MQASNDLFPFILLLESLAIIYYKTRMGKRNPNEWRYSIRVIEAEVSRRDARPLMGLH